jgi:hypothetical protein
MNALIFKMRLVIFFFLSLFAQHSSAQSLIINEVSQGPTGAKEYVELLVLPGTGPYSCNNYCADIRGWIIDDNNGYFSGGQTSGTGVAAGAVRFPNISFWSCIPVGTLIVIYNNNDVNASLPSQNDVSTTDGNCRIVIPVSSNLLEYQTTSPSTTSSSYPDTGWILGGAPWSPLGMSNSDDSFQIYSAAGQTTPLHAVSWGNNNTNNIIYFAGPAGNSVYYFANTNSNDPSSQTNWISGTCGNNGSPNDQTPGSPNNAANATFIASLTNSCAGPLTLTQGTINAASNCLCNGEATVNVQGSLNPYTYNWLDNTDTPINQTTATATGLCAGTYKCVVTSAIGCIDTLQLTVTDLDAVTPTFDPIAPVCQGTTFSLPSTSTNNISGTWSPAFNSQQTTTYTFNPNPGSCAVPINLTITIDPCGLNQETCFKIVTFNQVIASSCLVGADLGDEDPAISIWCNNTFSTLLFGTEWTLNIPAAGTYNLPNPWNVCQQNTNTWNIGAIPNNVTGLNVFVQTYESNDNNCQNPMTNSDGCRASANHTMNLTLGTHVLDIGGALSYRYTVTESNLISNVTLSNSVCNGNTYDATLTVTYINPATPCGLSGTLGDLVVNGQTFTATGSPQTITLSNLPADGLPVNINAYFDGNYATCQYDANNVFTAPEPPSLVSFSGEGNYCGNETPNNIVVDANGTTPFTVNFLLNGQATTISSPTNPISLGNTPGVYELTEITAGGCSASVNGVQTITISNGVTPEFDEVDPVCVGGSFALPSISNNGIDGTWTPAFNNTQTTTYTFTPTIGQCANTTTLTVEITNGVTPTFPTFGPYCPNATPDVLPNNSNNGISGTWSPATINTTQTGSGNYTFTPTAGICATPVTISVTVNNPTPPLIPSQTICLGESTILNATGNATYSWSGGVQNGVPFTPTATTTYTLTTTQNGCSATSEVTIFVDQPAVVSVEADVTEGLPPLAVNFTNNSSNGSQFVWDFGNGIEIPVNTTVGQVMTYNEIGVYEVILTGISGACETSDTLLIQVIPYAPAEVIVPNVFTPNSDNVNTVFELQMRFVKSFSAIILNRWGNVVIELNDSNPTWDGGDFVDGVYFVLYKATDFNDVVTEGQGFVHLMR